MKGFVVKMEKIVPKEVQVVLLFVFAALLLMHNLQGISRLLVILDVTFRIGFVILAVLILVLRKKIFHAHIVLYIMLFTQRTITLFQSVLSYNFRFKFFGTTPTIFMLAFALIEIYLVIIILAYLFKDKIKLEFKLNKHWFLFFIFAAYLLVFYSLNSLILVGLAIVLMLLSKEYFVAIILMACVFIGIPFSTLEMMVQDSFGGYSVLFYLRRLIELAGLGYLIYYAITQFVKDKKIIESAGE